MAPDNGLGSVEVIALQVSLPGISAAFQSAGHTYQLTHCHARRQRKPARSCNLTANADGGRINFDETLVHEHTVSRQQMQVSGGVSRKRLRQVYVEKFGFPLIVAEHLRVAKIGISRKPACDKDGVPQGQVAIGPMYTWFPHLTMDHDRGWILKIKPAEDSYGVEWLQRW